MHPEKCWGTFFIDHFVKSVFLALKPQNEPLGTHVTHLIAYLGKNGCKYRKFLPVP